MEPILVIYSHLLILFRILGYGFGLFEGAILGYWAVILGSLELQVEDAAAPTQVVRSALGRSTVGSQPSRGVDDPFPPILNTPNPLKLNSAPRYGLFYEGYFLLRGCIRGRDFKGSFKDQSGSFPKSGVMI